jgi:hypothetical protein
MSEPKTSTHQFLEQPNSALIRLVSFFSEPTLAEIEAALRIAKNGDRQLNETIYEEADDLFDSRYDYRAWRILETPGIRSDVIRKWGNPWELANAALACGNDIQAWGVFAALPRYFRESSYNEFQKPCVVQCAATCMERVEKGIAEITGGQAGCAFVKLLLVDVARDIFYKATRKISVKEAEQHAKVVMECLSIIDPLWIPSLSRTWPSTHTWPWLVSVEQESKDFFTGLNASELSAPSSRRVSFMYGRISREKLAGALSNVRNYVVLADMSSKESEHPSQALFEQAAEFTQASWFLRRQARRRQAENSALPTYSDGRSQELVALQAYSHALFDAGDFLANAAIAARFCWLLPEDLQDRKDFKKFCNSAFNVIRQRGYKVPEYLRWKVKDATGQWSWKHGDKAGIPQAPIAVQVEEPKDKGGEQEKLGSQSLGKLAGRGRLISRRLENMLSSDRRWQLIQSVYQRQTEDIGELSSLWDYLDWAEFHTRENQSFNDRHDISRAGFSLCLQLGELLRAGKFLSRLHPNPEEVLGFAAAMRRASQLLPLLLSAKKFSDWQTYLRDAFAKLRQTEVEAMSEGQHFLVHEMLTGRCVTLIRGSPKSLYKIYREKFDDEASESSLREALEEKISPNIQAAGTVTPQRLGNFSSTNRPNQLGEPVCASLVDLGSERFSLVVRDTRNEWHKTIFSVPGFASALQRTLEWSEAWHTHVGVPWEKEIITLVKKVGIFLGLPRNGTKWLMLSVSSESVNSHLARIPWQDLVSRHLDNNTVVSIVPNFTWARMEFRKPPQRSEAIHRLGTNPEYSKTAAAIRERMKAIDGAAFVLGHGTWKEHKFTSVEVEGGPLLEEAWQNYATRRVCVVHACSGGRSEDHMLGDLGGLPYNGFVLGCRFFCAPVCEVSSETATILQHHLTDEFAPPELGLRYLNAIQEDPAVALYTIYGFANEPAKLKPRLAKRGELATVHAFA